VNSSTGTHNCAENTTCPIEITDTTYSESFTAIPEEGYVFSKWMGGDSFMCGDSTDPVCPVSNTLLAGDSRFDAWLASYLTFYIMPVFEFVGIDTDGDGIPNHIDEDDDNDGIFDIDDQCPLDPSPDCSMGVPLTDTVTINGTEWAQVDLFKSLSWSDMNAICSGGPCSGLLNGYNMAGWILASRADVKALFDYYICGLEAIGCFDGLYDEYNSAWAPIMFTDGMRPTYDASTFRYIKGLVADVNNADPGFVRNTYWSDAKMLTGGDAARIEYNYDGIYDSSHGGWFYRTP
jgi:hypothetical protein